MSGPAWLEWIKPAPANEEQLARAVEEFGCVVGCIKMKERDFDAARRAKAALRAIQALPSELKELPEALSFAQALEFRINWTGDPRKNPSNRPTKTNKRFCIVSVQSWLHNRGSHISGGETGTLPNLALAVWIAAGHRAEGETPKAWAQALQRMLKVSREINNLVEIDNREQGTKASGKVKFCS